ncbi:redoxin domain-containing protein [Desulfomicrobium baculatum]|uniref:Alkyl hydroperoxide reductase/ Thiol specific antioxidant/ Mal allergen n=1 Tax=Desulfomicrobium baculatum (strain DSM 4028 / VKM B-1378 / X) TaxID=525897 RepID=C7LQE1_DESBD|nr:redoxin domain-containing protein [Desulfomicrobium baculatum]ACU90343.1 alkyl hydroperoxide reductase/ Thiol specific antioxidant/ Mal allergen [Desulfomicrobium baculatum DSM 4028]
MTPTLPASLFFVALLLFLPAQLPAQEASIPPDRIYETGQLKPVDSTLKVKVGDQAPDFSLPTISGETVTLAQFRGNKNVVLSFIPAAWTPVCSGQWPGYNIVQDMFEQTDTQLIGISADNVPTLHAWVQEMGGVWFTVASDFYPHGQLADSLGILRSTGETERALFLIDKEGIIRYIDVHDINSRPDLGPLIKAMQSLK